MTTIAAAPVASRRRATRLASKRRLISAAAMATVAPMNATATPMSGAATTIVGR